MKRRKTSAAKHHFLPLALSLFLCSGISAQSYTHFQEPDRSGGLVFLYPAGYTPPASPEGKTGGIYAHRYRPENGEQLMASLGKDFEKCFPALDEKDRDALRSVGFSLIFDRSLRVRAFFIRFDAASEAVVRQHEEALYRLGSRWVGMDLTGFAVPDDEAKFSGSEYRFALAFVMRYVTKR